MKTKEKKPFTGQVGMVVMVCVFCFFASVLHAQTTEKAKWEYPIKPGSDEWKATSYAKKVELSQPPKELLNSWDTETLFNYCVDYPFNTVVMLFNNPSAGFMRAYEEATMWQEFIRRKDAVEVFANYFEDRPYKRMFERTDTEVRNEELFTMYFLEKLVSLTDFTDHLDSSLRRKLAAVILQTHLSKKEYPDRVYGYPFNSSLSALVKILESDKEVSANDEISLSNFRRKTGNESFADDSMDSAILTKVFNYLNKQQ